MNDNFAEPTSKNIKNMQLDNYTDLVGCFNVNMQIEGGVKIRCPLRSAFIIT